MEHVLENEEEEHLRCDGRPRRERYLPGRHAKEFCHGVEEPDNGELNGEVAEENLLGAGPLFTGSRDLVWLKLPLAEVGHSVDNDPWDRPAEVYDLPCNREEDSLSL